MACYVRGQLLQGKKACYVYNACHKRKQGGQFKIVNQGAAFSAMSEHAVKDKKRDFKNK
jgi:hypothetical protein